MCILCAKSSIEARAPPPSSRPLPRLDQSEPADLSRRNSRRPSMRKRRGLTLIAATSVAVLLSGCGGSAGGSSSSGGTTTGITDKKVMIGLNSVLSGPQAVYQNIGLGAEAYLKAAEPINGYTFDFQEKDNALSAAQSASASRALATNSFMLVSGGTA